MADSEVLLELSDIKKEYKNKLEANYWTKPQNSGTICIKKER